MQKIGEALCPITSDTVMRVQVFDRVFDEIPTVDEALETICNFRLLPIDYPSELKKQYRPLLLGRPYPDDANITPMCSRPVRMSAILSNCYYNQAYPDDELTYICNEISPINKQHERTDGYTDRTQMWYEVNRAIEGFFLLWKNVEYENLGDGTFEYPSREQQRHMRSETA